MDDREFEGATLLADRSEADPHADWCVEVGAMLAAMDTDSLCEALDAGTIKPESRVWRPGLDGWTPIEDLPELAERPSVRGLQILADCMRAVDEAR